MFLFRNSTVTITLATLVTAPNLIAILDGKGEKNSFLYGEFRLLRPYKYSLLTLAALAISIIPAYIANIESYSVLASKLSMVVIYSLSYSLIAPFLYKIATATNGVKYNLKHVVYTILVVGVSEFWIYSLRLITSAYPMTSLLAAPLVCLVYILSLYLLTVVNLMRNPPDLPGDPKSLTYAGVK